MKRVLFSSFLLLLAAGSALAQTADSSAALFDDSVMHEFRITVYEENWQDTLAVYFQRGDESLPARVEYGGLVFDSVGIRYKGNSSYMQSRGTPKKPFKIEFDEYRGKQTFFGVKTLNFSNAVKDPTFMREKLAYDMLRTLMPSPRCAYATLTVNGMALGVYTMVEQVDKTFLARHFATNSGNLYKAGDNGASLEYRGEDSTPYKNELELKTNEKADDWSRLITMLRIVGTSSAGTFQTEAGNVLHLDNSARILAFNMAVSNFDSYTGSGRNFYLYDNVDDGRFAFIPWDANEAFGAYTNNWNIFTQDVTAPNNLQRRPILRRILENDELRALYLRYIRAIIRGPASLDSLRARTDHWKQFLAPHVQADQYKLYTYQQFVDNIEKDVLIGINQPVPGLLRFAQLRNESIETQLGGYLAVEGAPGTLPDAIELAALYPNPAVTHSTLSFTLRGEGSLSVLVRNVLGAEVWRYDVADGARGSYAVLLPVSALPSGAYHCEVQLRSAGGLVATKSLTFTVAH